VLNLTFCSLKKGKKKKKKKEKEKTEKEEGALYFLLAKDETSGKAKGLPAAVPENWRRLSARSSRKNSAADKARKKKKSGVAGQLLPKRSDSRRDTARL